MAFIVRDLTEEEREKYNLSKSESLRCAIDIENNAVLISRGRQGGSDSYGNKYEFIWNGNSTTWIDEPQSQKDKNGQKTVLWNLGRMKIKPELQDKKSDLTHLIKEALIVYGKNGCNDNPTFKYHTLKISGLEEEQIIYKVKG